MNVNSIQRAILVIIDHWVRTNKTPIEQRIIVELISVDHDMPSSTIKAATRVLVKKGYIRKSSSLIRNVSYVQLRSI